MNFSKKTLTKSKSLEANCDYHHVTKQELSGLDKSINLSERHRFRNLKTGTKIIKMRLYSSSVADSGIVKRKLTTTASNKSSKNNSIEIGNNSQRLDSYSTDISSDDLIDQENSQVFEESSNSGSIQFDSVGNIYSKTYSRLRHFV